ncbi:MAG: glycosyltransferase family 2 protein [Armatimonadetes bacterium]|nr:glycosyltransferase family 2 protein [Armatimonadota bacterium]
MADGIDISVVIPAYNESARLGAPLARVRSWLEAYDQTAEIIVVDDGSADDTADVARRGLEGFPAAQVLRNEPNAGKGASVRRGVLAARGDYVLFSDADLSVDIADWTKLRAAHEAGADIAIGSRAIRGSHIDVHQPWHRELAGRCFNVFIRAFVMSGIHDTQCGFKSFARPCIQSVFSRQTIERWGFDVELLYIAQRLGFRIAEVPITWRNDAATKINAAADGFKMLGEALEARKLHRHLTPKDRD